MTLKRAFWIVCALMVANYLVMVLWSLPILTQEANGLLPFDLRPSGYSTQEAQAFLAVMGQSARAFYLGPQHWLDTVYPGLLALTLTMAYLLLFPRRFAVTFSVVALAAAVFDWGENMMVARLLRMGASGIDDTAVSTASLFTIMKSATVTLALVILLVGLARMGWTRWKGRTT